MLFTVSNRSVCYFRLLKFTLRKNRLNRVYLGDSIQQERLPVSLELLVSFLMYVIFHITTVVLLPKIGV